MLSKIISNQEFTMAWNAVKNGLSIEKYAKNIAADNKVEARVSYSAADLQPPCGGGCY